MKDVGKFYGRFVYFTAILVYIMGVWYILWSLCHIFFPVLVCCTEKNLAALCVTLAVGTSG
jgi:hypothetical protein